MHRLLFLEDVMYSVIELFYMRDVKDVLFCFAVSLLPDLETLLCTSALSNAHDNSELILAIDDQELCN